MRYLRHEQLIGKPAQKSLQKKTIAIVGLGALGTNTASLLARAGISLKLIDFDNIELSNLQRQSLYDDFIVPLQGESYPNLEASFSYLDFWPIYFDLNLSVAYFTNSSPKAAGENG